MLNDLYDLSRQSSRAAALEAELKCLKANIGPPTVAPVQLADIAPPEVTAAVPMSPLRPFSPVTPIDNIVVQGQSIDITRRRPPVSIVQSSDTTHAITLNLVNPNAEDVNPHASTDNCRGAGIFTSQSPYDGASISTSTTPYFSSAIDSTVCRQETLSRRPLQTFPRSPPEEPMRTQPIMTSMPCPLTLVRPPSREEVMTSMWRPRTPPIVPVDNVMTSTALPRPLAMPVDHAMTSAVPHPPAVPRDQAVTSTLSDKVF